MPHGRSLRSLILIALLAMILGACVDGELPEGTAAPGEPGTTVEAPEPTEAPPGTESPDTTAAPPVTEAQAEGEGEGISPEALYIGLGILLLFLVIGWLMGRSRKRAPAPAAAPTPAGAKTYGDYVRDGYSEARWLFDALTDELALWRGNALFDDRTAPEDSAGTSMADRWAQIDSRMNNATDQLYRAEAAAPDQATAATVRQTVDALSAARTAVDGRAEARFNTRGVAADDQHALAQAAERERLASSTLAEARRTLNDALIALSAVS